MGLGWWHGITGGNPSCMLEKGGKGRLARGRQVHLMVECSCVLWSGSHRCLVHALPTQLQSAGVGKPGRLSCMQDVNWHHRYSVLLPCINMACHV